ncbi:MAG TPA: RNA-guided endonuclease TnpB family protein [Streptosporangiaceae bacterium]|nr:RNA-guided endonuclease TnpB family protein [Streptosporangiaceae bacterium]
MRTAYRCRAYPDAAQQAMLNRTFGCVRVVWNRTLAARQARYATEGKSTSYAQADRALTVMKRDPDLAFLGEVSCVPLQQALRHQHAAFRAFFARRARYPRFKSRHGRQSATWTRSAFRMRGTELHLAKMTGPLQVTWTWPGTALAGLHPTSVTVARDPAGRWFVTFHAEVHNPEPLPAAGAAIGIDLGLKNFAVRSHGPPIPHPRHTDRYEQRLKRHQRRLARCQKNSANRAKAARKVARTHARVADARRDFLHQASTRLIRQFDVIAVEDLAVKNMVRNRKLARAISRTGWGEFRRQLEYKAQRHGRVLAVADRWFPSSKTCSACGFVLAELDLGTRQWTCPACGARHDRDVNAAKNILAAGLAAAAAKNGGDACGADVRHEGQPPVQTALKQEPRPARAGIPAPQGRE